MIQEKKIHATHNLILENRKNLSISGVSDVDSFDEKQISAFTEMGLLVVKGNDLHINQFNTQSGELSVSGLVEELVYTVEEKRTASSFISKLFH